MLKLHLLYYYLVSMYLATPVLPILRSKTDTAILQYVAVLLYRFVFCPGTLFLDSFRVFRAIVFCNLQMIVLTGTTVQKLTSSSYSYSCGFRVKWCSLIFITRMTVRPVSREEFTERCHQQCAKPPRQMSYPDYASVGCAPMGASTEIGHATGSTTCSPKETKVSALGKESTYWRMAYTQ